ncbi:MAG: hydrolase, partial [uncultured bacterium]
DIAKKAQELHINSQGVSRYKKFKEIHKCYLNKECTEEESDMLSQKFSNIVFQKIVECPFIEGVLEFLEKMQAIKVPVFLLSATPNDELREICDRRKIARFFKETLGSPYEKVFSAERLIKEHQFDPAKAIFVGDSLSDFSAAAFVGVSFIGLVTKGHLNPFVASSCCIESFRDLL